jgi:copper homeostasis protein
VNAPLALEVIATSLDDALAAEQGGAARIELVRALDAGGLTPSMPLVESVLARVRIPVRVMVRETQRHDVPDSRVRRRLVDQARAIGQHPVDGLVFGALAGGRIDHALLDAIAGASGRPITFHRAFEELADPDGGLIALARHPAVDRVLCDGGAGSWPERAARLAAWAAHAGAGLLVLPGGGITDQALAALARVPGLREVHVGRLVREPATVDGVVSARRVAALVAHLRQLQLKVPGTC